MFSTQATRLCLALRGVARLPPLDAKRIDGVLRAAGRYALMVHSSSSMTPTVIADRGARVVQAMGQACHCSQLLSVPSAVGRRSTQPAVSEPRLSVLAMCLLNSEILDNGHGIGGRADDVGISRQIDVPAI
jgi:hypothetical protein